MGRGPPFVPPWDYGAAGEDRSSLRFDPASDDRAENASQMRKVIYGMQTTAQFETVQLQLRRLS
jgi:hypothetical protein